MSKELYPCLWFDGNAKEAATFYCDVFEGNITQETPMVVNWELFGQKFMGLNGGPQFVANPSISFFITCETHEEIDAIYSKLSEGAMIMMALDKYDWSEYYAFFKDKFGVSWQIFKGKYSDVNQKITPSFLYTDERFGKANDAVHFYTSVFPNSTIDGILLYTKEEIGSEGIVKHSQFRLNGNVFMAMDGMGNHNFSFNEATSFVVHCDNQEDIDYYWDKLTSDGGEEGRCGWCKDKFGVSWQVIPSILGQLVQEKGHAVVDAFLKMNKFDIETLMKA